MPQEKVIGSIVCEAANDVVPVSPRVRTNPVSLLDALRVCVARDVQPNLSPALTMLARLKQSIHNALVGIDLLVVQVVVDLGPASGACQ